MAINISERLKIAQQLGFLGRGGGRKSIGQEIADLLVGAGKGAQAAGTGFAEGSEARKKALEARELEEGMKPFSSLFGVPSAEEEQSLKDQIFNIPSVQRSKAIQDILNQLTTANLPREEIESLTEEELRDKGYVVPPPPAPFVSKREELQKRFPNVPIDIPISRFKDVASGLALSGTTTLYMDQNTGEIGIQRTANSIPIATVPEKQVATILAGKERAKIMAGGAEQRQQRGFEEAEQRQQRQSELQEEREKRAEERKAAGEAEKMSADQEKAIKNVNALRSFIDDYYSTLDKLVPPSDTLKGIVKSAGKVGVSKIPIVGTAYQPNIKAFEKFREASRAKIARALGDVGNLSQTEQENAIKLLSGGISSGAERLQAKSLIENILLKAEERALGAVEREKIERARGFLSRERLSRTLEPKGFQQDFIDAQKAIKQGADSIAVKNRLKVLYPKMSKTIDQELK